MGLFSRGEAFGTIASLELLGVLVGVMVLMMVSAIASGIGFAGASVLMRVRTVVCTILAHSGWRDK